MPSRSRTSISALHCSIVQCLSKKYWHVYVYLMVFVCRSNLWFFLLQKKNFLVLIHYVTVWCAPIVLSVKWWAEKACTYSDWLRRILHLNNSPSFGCISGSKADGSFLLIALISGVDVETIFIWKSIFWLEAKSQWFYVAELNNMTK